MKLSSKFAKIPWWLIIGSFILGAGFIGAVLLILKIIGEGAEKDGENVSRTYTRTYTTHRTTTTQNGTTRSSAYSQVKQSAADVDYKPVGESPRSSRDTASAGAAFSASSRGDTPKNDTAKAPAGADINRIYPRGYGKVLTFFGAFFMVLGMAVSLVGLGTAAVSGKIGGLIVSIVASALLCLPGGIMFFCGKNRRAKASRFRKYHSIIGDDRTVNIEVLAETIPTTYEKACRDLQEMIDAGLFPGMYIDAHTGCLTDNYDRIRRKKSSAPRKKTSGAGFPEEVRIRQLNDIIEDAYVSERMDRLESLTRNILDYLEKNPHKESIARQFKNHYLPTTIKILEAYAKFEKQESRGANVASAMADVEQIMDKLVDGFEKQLDALYADEALDIASDIEVLENMMDMSGLTSKPDFTL